MRILGFTSTLDLKKNQTKNYNLKIIHMIQVKKNNVIIPLKIWNELKESTYFRELIEVLEDSKELEKAKNETTHFVDFKKYDKKRRASIKNV